MTIAEKMQMYFERHPFMSLTDVIADIFAEEIINFNIFPETALIVSNVADTCHVSRTPVKAAFDQLTAEGFLEQKGKKYIVKPFNTEDYLNYYLFRTELEAKAIRITAECIMPEELEQVKRKKELLNKALAARSAKAIIGSEVDFHKYIVDCSHNPYFISAYAGIASQVRRYGIYAVHDVANHQKYILQHELIYMSLCLGDPDACEAAVRAHLSKYPKTYERDYIPLREKYLKAQTAGKEDN